MNKQQRFQKLKLTDSIISCSSRLLSFFTKYTNSDMCLKYHVNIISSITDGHCYFLWEPLSNPVNNISLLFWRNSTSKYHVTIITHCKELILQKLITIDGYKRCTCNDDSLFTILSSAQMFNIFLNLRDYGRKIVGVCLVDNMLCHCPIQETS